VGLTSEVKLPLPHVSLQVDVLFRHAGANHADCAFTSCVYSETRANIFEFPVLTRYGLRRPAAAAPFVEAGLAYQWVRHAYGGALSWRTGPIVPGEVVDLSVHRGSVSMPAENHLGFVAGGGVEFRSGRFRVAPEIRYTRWNARYWEVFGARGFFTGSNLNQIDGLVGVGF